MHYIVQTVMNISGHLQHTIFNQNRRKDKDYNKPELNYDEIISVEFDYVISRLEQ